MNVPTQCENTLPSLLVRFFVCSQSLELRQYTVNPQIIFISVHIGWAQNSMSVTDKVITYTGIVQAVKAKQKTQKKKWLK
jgi:hypothetical protein